MLNFIFGICRKLDLATNTSELSFWFQIVHDNTESALCNKTINKPIMLDVTNQKPKQILG